MNRIVRNLIVILLGAASSLAVASLLFLLELRGGRSLFSITVASWIPAGAIGAGLVAAAGYYASSRLLRLRPARVMLAAILLLSAGTVYLMDSVDYGLMRVNRKSIHGAAAIGGFVSDALVQSPLRAAFAGSGGSAAGGSTPSAGAMSAVAGDNNSSVQGIGGGVQGMLDTGDALSADNMSDAMSGAKQRICAARAGVRLYDGVAGRVAVAGGTAICRLRAGGAGGVYCPAERLLLR